MTTSREERFRQLSDDVSGPLRAYVVRRVAPADVDDVMAEISLVLWRRLDEVPAEEPLAWCYGVARKQVANQHRGDQRRLRLVDRVRTVDPPREATSWPDDGEHAEVHAALAQLKELDREVIQLWAWEQLAPREIAEVTGLTPNAVSIRLHKAKKKLAALLETPSKKNSGSGKNPADAGHIPFEQGS